MRKPLTPKSIFGFSQLWALSIWIAGVASAIKFNSIPQPQLNLDDLGKVGLAGDFDAISVYAFEGQKVSVINQNGSDSVMIQLPNGAFTPLVTADANIQAICTFELKNGTVLGMVVGGNFTSLGGVEANGIALVNPEDAKVTPLSGLTGKVNALLCDKDTETLYIGGEFRGVNSSNALQWTRASDWQNLPFEGFNKPVKSIVKSSTGSIIFGGLFDGLGNITAPASQHTQTLNLQTATITTEQTTGREGFNNPSSIICGSGQDGPGSTWLLGDGQVGSWTADFKFSFRPTKLRLRNTHFEGRGTAEFRFTAFPIGGIMNFSYVDPADNTRKFCESRCPLSNNPDVEFQDFEFVNVIGMSNFRIDISRFHGAGAGLAGLEVFLDDVFTYAVNDFNEPSCNQGGARSNSQVQGQWTLTTAQTDSPYLVANIPAGTTEPHSVTFFPNVQASGNYSVVLFTPGCILDGSCATRGRVNITANYSRDQSTPVITELFQSNNFDKYDIIYQGYVDAAEDGFRPSVTISPSRDQGAINVVAQKLRFDLISNTTLGLNGIYEYVPGSRNSANFKDSPTIRSATEKLKPGARVLALATKDSTLYAAGNFTSKDSNEGFNYVYGVERDGPRAFARKGLNGPVWTSYADGKNTLYLGGEFTNTAEQNTPGLNRVAIYDTSSNTWSTMGNGVNGRVKDIVPLSMTINGEKLEVIAVSGDFTEILASNDKQSVNVDGFAIWVPSSNEWLPRIKDAVTIHLDGTISASSLLPDGVRVFTGSVSSHDLLASGAVTLESKDKLTLKALPLKFVFNEGNSTIRKRATPIGEIEGVATGAFYQEGGKDLTVLGGHFAVEGKNGQVNNLAIINHQTNNEITGLSGMAPTGTFITLHIHSGILYAGGSVTGRVGNFDVGGMILYNLNQGKLVDSQPAGLQGSNATVNTISTRPKSDKVFVGGSFLSAGSFSCPALCVYEAASLQWTRPGGDAIGGSINAMQWINVDELLVVGDMVINNTATYIAQFNARNFVWSAFGSGDNRNIPGPVTAMALDSDNGNSVFITGSSSDNKPYVWKWTGSQWKDIGSGFGPLTNIRGLQVLKLKNNHESNDILRDNHILLVTGEIDLPNVGIVSGATYNGLTWTPFLLTSKSNDQQSSLAAIFTQREQTFTSSGGNMRKAYVILIALAIALALVFLIVVLGVLASYIRRRKEGYQPAPTMITEKSANIQDRVPPAFLFGSVGASGNPRDTAPTL